MITDTCYKISCIGIVVFGYALILLAWYLWLDDLYKLVLYAFDNVIYWLMDFLMGRSK